MALTLIVPTATYTMLYVVPRLNGTTIGVHANHLVCYLSINYLML